MQKLKMGNSECLTFFDSGENAHLIDGDLAKKEKFTETFGNSFCIWSDQRWDITTESGSFRFNLGSGKDGVCHEIKAIGIKNVTSEFGEYRLEEIGKEFMSSETESKKEYILPKTVGGTKVHLLLGVKNSRIQPVLLRVLSSDIGVYLNPFKGVWGSRIILAGPSKFSLKLIMINKEKPYVLCTW